MKYFVFVMVVVSLVALMAVGASATNSATNFYSIHDFDGTKTLVGDGFTYLPTYSFDDNLSHYADQSVVQGGGADRITDVTSNFSGYVFQVGEDPAYGGVDNGVRMKWGGMITGKFWSDAGSGGMTGFGYTSIDQNRAVFAGIRQDYLNIKDIGGAHSIAAPLSMTARDNNSANWHVYSLRWHYGGNFDVYVTKGADWSSNAADWLTLATNVSMTNNGVLATGSLAAPIPNQAMGGIFLGNACGRTDTASFLIDYVSMQSNGQTGTSDFTVNPWDWDPLTGAPAATPEPGSILALGSGLIAMAGLALRRRRA